MKLIFNKNGSGNAEIKDLLAHLDADYKFSHLQTDIEHETITLVKLIGQVTYDKIAEFYEQGSLGANPTQPEIHQRAKEDDLVKKTKLAILVFAELAYAPNNDINTSNNGRVIDLGEYQRQPWEWQLNKAESASLRRGYKALDVLIATLVDYGLVEWDNSEEYKVSKQYFIYNTDQFDSVYKIMSRQLYMRLVPYMNDVEEDEVLPVIGADRFANLKTKIVDDALLDDDKKLLQKVQRVVGYRVLEESFVNLPVEMFPEGTVVYREKGLMASQARSEKQLWFKQKADDHLKKLEDYITSLTPVTETEEFDPTENMGDGKYINL